MKRFIFNIISFVLLLLIINTIFFRITYKLYLQPYEDVSFKHEIYLLSDSHGEALGGLDAYGIYNFSAGSDSYYDMQRRVEYLIIKTNLYLKFS